MTTPLETIEAEALKLSPQERALLVDRLAASISDTFLFEDEWVGEAMRRDAALDARNAARTLDEALACARRAIS